jgi:hypothetical protein
MRYCYAVLAFLIGLIAVPSFSSAPTSETPSSGVYQLIGVRNCQPSCYGLVIQLRSLTLRDSISADELTIIETKHNHELKPIMTWSVSPDQKRLTITFKPGMGGFGTGNVVTVQLNGSALRPPNPNQGYTFAIATDPL